MPYCTKQDLIDRFAESELIQLTDRSNSGLIDDTVLNKAIADADAEIDSKLKNRYTVPLSPTPDILNLKACDIARYFLYEDSPTDHVTKRYDDAIKFLKEVRDGKESLGVDTPAPTTSPGRMKVRQGNSVTDWDTY